jgi:5-methylcytosine-specific restriction enzyme A
MAKLPSGTTARSGFEWVGETPDTPAPGRVRLRILERQGGRCALTGHKFRPGDKKRLDHLKPVIDGGLNRESNLQWILDVDHKAKTKAEAKVRKSVRKRARSHAGIKAAPPRPLQSRNDLPTGKPKVKKLPTPTHLPTQLERLYVLRKPQGRKR